MKYLICSGDSFTDHYWRSTEHPEMDTSWPKWPELLGEKLNMKVINVGSGGQGNEYIYSTLHDVIESIDDKSEIGLVIAGWSQCYRRDYQTGNSKDHLMRWHSDAIDKRGNILGWVKRSLRTFKSFEYMCKYHNIPYIQFQMIPLFMDHLRGHCHKKYYDSRYNGIYEEDIQYILKTMLYYEKILDTTKFIGWPGYEDIGCFALNDKVLGVGTMEEQNAYGFIVSEKDEHPNAAGQVKLANYIYDSLDT